MRCLLIAESIGEIEIFDVPGEWSEEPAAICGRAARGAASYLRRWWYDRLAIGAWNAPGQSIHGLATSAPLWLNGRYVGEVFVVITPTPEFRPRVLA